MVVRNKVGLSGLDEACELCETELAVFVWGLGWACWRFWRCRGSCACIFLHELGRKVCIVLTDPDRLGKEIREGIYTTYRL